jgi:hypothetical protein
MTNLRVPAAPNLADHFFENVFHRRPRGAADSSNDREAASLPLQAFSNCSKSHRLGTNDGSPMASAKSI